MRYLKGLTGATLILQAPEFFVAGFIIGAVGVGSLCYSIGRHWAEIERMFG